MPQFAYKAKAESGAALQGVIEAADRSQALRQLKAMGYYLLALDERRLDQSWREQLRSAFGARIRPRDVALLTRQLASLLEAGLLVAESLRILARQCENLALGRLVEALAARVEGSKSLSAAMAEHPRVFSPQYTSIIRAGEEGGMLPESLTRLADHLEADVKFREQVRSALAYPAFLCISGVAVVAILLTFVIPRFLSLFAALGQDLPLPTRILIATSSFMATWWPVILMGLLVLIFGCVQLLRTRQGRLGWHRAKLNLPVIGQVSHKAEMAVFSQTFAALIGSGVRVVQALEISAETLGNRHLSERVGRLAEAVRQGKSIHQAMDKQEVFPVVLVSMTAVGEQTGQLDDLVARAAEVLREESQRAIQRLTMLLEPALIVMLGGLVALIVAAILLPIFRSSALVQ